MNDQLLVAYQHVGKGVIEFTRADGTRFKSVPPQHPGQMKSVRNYTVVEVKNE